MIQQEHFEKNSPGRGAKFQGKPPGDDADLDQVLLRREEAGAGDDLQRVRRLCSFPSPRWSSLAYQHVLLSLLVPNLSSHVLTSAAILI